MFDFSAQQSYTMVFLCVASAHAAVHLSAAASATTSDTLMASSGASTMGCLVGIWQYANCCKDRARAAGAEARRQTQSNIILSDRVKTTSLIHSEVIMAQWNHHETNVQKQSDHLLRQILLERVYDRVADTQIHHTKAKNKDLHCEFLMSLGMYREELLSDVDDLNKLNEGLVPQTLDASVFRAAATTVDYRVAELHKEKERYISSSWRLWISSALAGWFSLETSSATTP